MFGINWGNFIGKKRFKKNNIKTKDTKTEIAKDKNVDLKSNCRDMNFELLAIDIVKSITKKGEWTHTPWCDDKNRDGVLCISIYQNCVSQWWMEAKFTYNLKDASLSRYRLDSTIVSKLLMEMQSIDSNMHRIKKLFIVTNASVAPSVQNNIIMSLNANGKHCKLCIYQRADVEFWLFNNKDKYKYYFNGTPDYEPYDDFYIDSNVQIYPEKAKYSNFYYDTGERITITQHQRYVFSVYAYSKKSEVTILPKKNIKIINPDKIEIKNNKIQFVFSVEDKPDSLIFNINGKESPYVNFQYKPDTFLEIQSHKEIKKVIARFINKKVNSSCSTLMILGKVAVGKTTLLNLIMQDLHKNFYFITLGNKFNENIKSFSKFIGNLILPFVPWNDLDQEYIAKLKSTCGSGFQLFDFLLQLCEETDNDNFEKEIIINKINKMNFKFPSDLNYYTTVLFVDNIQNLGEVDGLFLTKCLEGLQNSSLKIKILFFGNTYFKDNSFYHELRKYTVLSNDLPKEPLLCELTNKDIINHFNKVFDAQLVEIPRKSLFGDLFEISEFIQYIQENKVNLTSDKVFEDVYNRYRQSDISNNVIKNRILNALNRCNECTRKTLQKIYLLPQPYYNSENNWKKSVDRLLDLQLIKLNESNGYLEPYHDLYRNVYLRFLFENRQLSENIFMNDQERLIYTFTYNSPNTTEWVQAAEELYCNRHRFPDTVLFALEPTFCNVDEKKDSLIREWGAERFFELYKAYATVCGYASTVVSGAEEHKKLIKWSKEYPQSIQIRRFAVAAYASLMENAYESAEFNEMKKSYNQFREEYISLSPFITEDLHEWNIRNYLIESLSCYVQSIFDIKNAENNFLIHRKKYLSEPDGLFHFYEDTARFARTLYVKDLDKAIYYTEDAIKIMNSKETHADRKQIKILNFQKTYLNMVKNDDAHLINDLVIQYKAFSEGFQEMQRKIRLALIMVCLKYNNVSLADDLLREEIETPQPRNKRLEIFYWQARALKSLVTNNLTYATKCLKIAANKAQGIPTFLHIINHNLKVLTSNPSPIECRFAVTENLQDGIYYIDTRAAY